MWALLGDSTLPHYNIRQYMSYKIVGCALMNHINKDCEINVPSSPSLTPSSQAMSGPQRLTPDRLPDPWVLDTESLLSELARVRSLALTLQDGNAISGKNHAR